MNLKEPVYSLCWTPVQADSDTHELDSFSLLARLARNGGGESSQDVRTLF
jgi:hypothetical protein